MLNERHLLNLAVVEPFVSGAGFCLGFGPVLHGRALEPFDNDAGEALRDQLAHVGGAHGAHAGFRLGHNIRDAARGSLPASHRVPLRRSLNDVAHDAFLFCSSADTASLNFLVGISSIRATPMYLQNFGMSAPTWTISVCSVSICSWLRAPPLPAALPSSSSPREVRL